MVCLRTILVSASKYDVEEATLATELSQLGLPKENSEAGGRVWLSVEDERLLPAVLACVEKWELDKFPESVTLETFPASPRAESHGLVAWLFNEIFTVYIGEKQIPNAS